MSNTKKTQKRLEEAIIPYLSKKSDWKEILDKKVWEILNSDRATYTLVGEVKGHIKLKNKEEKDYLILWLKEGEEKIHVYEDKLMYPEKWKEILDSKYHRRVVFLDFQKIYKLKILKDIRYEK